MSMHEPLNDRLPILLLDVAQQIDRKLGGKSLDQTIFDQFGQELARTTGIQSTSPTQRFLHDPFTAGAFAQAIAEFSDGVSDVDELTAEIKKILDSMPSERTDNELKTLKRFCLALHRSIMAYQALPIFDENPWDDDRSLSR